MSLYNQIKSKLWLIKHNVFYRKLYNARQILISEENLTKYASGDGAVPDSLVDAAVISEVANDRFGDDDTSYARPDSSDGAHGSHATPPVHTDAAGSTWSHTGVVDVNSVRLNPALIKRLLDAKLHPDMIKRPHRRKNRVLVMPAGSSAFMMDQNDPDVDHGAFPTLFPYGVAGPTFYRAQFIGAERYTQRLMRLADRRFSTHPPFCFTMFSVIQRRRVCWGSQRCLDSGFFMDFSKEVDKLSPEAINKVIEELELLQKRGRSVNLRALSDANKPTAKALSRLFDKMTSLGGSHLPRSPGSKKDARRELTGMYIKLGLPDLFVTVNPEDRHSPLVVHFHGRHVPLSLDDPDMPTGMSSAFDRFRIVVNDPLAAVQFSAHVMDSFIAALLGFNDAEPSASSKRLGVFGDVLAYHFNDEEQGRGSLHYHGLVWLKHKPDTNAFEKLIREPAFQQRVLAYLSAVIKNELPSQWDVSELRLDDDDALTMPKHIYLREQPCYLRDCDGRSHSVLDGDASKMTYHTRAADDHISLKRVSDPLAPHFFRDACNDLMCLGPQSVFHLETHTKCCFKDRRNQMLPRSQRQCRFDKPGKLNEKPHFDSDGNAVLRRRHHWCGSYNPWLLAALRCNHDVTPMWGFGTRHMAVIMYITNYITKLNQKLLSQLPLIEAAVKLFQKWKDPDQTAEQQSRSLLLKVHSHLQRDVELSLHSVVHTLAGFKERYVSHKPIKLCTTSFLSCLEQDDAQRGHFECEYELNTGASKYERFRVTHTQDARAFVSNQRLDYQFRPVTLDNCCLYDFICCWFKQKRPPASKTDLAESVEPDEEQPDEQELADHFQALDVHGLFEFAKDHPQREEWGLKF